MVRVSGMSRGRGRCDGLVLKIVSPRKFVQNSLNLPFC